MVTEELEGQERQGGLQRGPTGERGRKRDSLSSGAHRAQLEAPEPWELQAIPCQLRLQFQCLLVTSIPRSKCVSAMCQLGQIDKKQVSQ